MRAGWGRGGAGGGRKGFFNQRIVDGLRMDGLVRVVGTCALVRR